jgi:hypothetical protein
MGFFIVRPVRRKTNQSPFSSLSVLSQVKCVPQPARRQVNIHNDFRTRKASTRSKLIACLVTAITAPDAAPPLDLLSARLQPLASEGTGATEGDTAMAWLVLAASAPAIVCVLSAAFLAYQQRPAWGWFLGLSIGAEFAALLLMANLRAFA